MVTNLQELVPFVPYHAHAPSKNILWVIYCLLQSICFQVIENSIFKPWQLLNQVLVWFLEIAFVWKTSSCISVNCSDQSKSQDSVRPILLFYC